VTVTRSTGAVLFRSGYPPRRVDLHDLDVRALAGPSLTEAVLRRGVSIGRRTAGRAAHSSPSDTGRPLGGAGRQNRSRAADRAALRRRAPVTDTRTTSTSSAAGGGGTLRLGCPQWQGGGTSSVRTLAAEIPFDVARRGYAVGSAVFAAVLPSVDGTTATVPIGMGDEGLAQVDGAEAKEVLLGQLASALEVIEQHAPARIATLGGECASASPRSPPSPAATVTTWPSCGSTPTRHRHAGQRVPRLPRHGGRRPDWPRTPRRPGAPARHHRARPRRPGRATRLDRGRLPQRRRVGHPVLQPGRAALLDPTAAGVARGDRLLAGCGSLRRRHRRQQRDSAGTGRRPGRSDQPSGPPHRRGPDRRSGRRGRHHRRILPPPGHAPAADPARLSAHLAAR
jgi:hypothetical protein